MIDSMQLERSVVTLLLSNYLDEEEEEGDWDEEANTMPATKVWSVCGLGQFSFWPPCAWVTSFVGPWTCVGGQTC